MPGQTPSTTATIHPGSTNKLGGARLCFRLSQALSQAWNGTPGGSLGCSLTPRTTKIGSGRSRLPPLDSNRATRSGIPRCQTSLGQGGPSGLDLFGFVWLASTKCEGKKTFGGRYRSSEALLRFSQDFIPLPGPVLLRNHTGKLLVLLSSTFKLAMIAMTCYTRQCTADHHAEHQADSERFH